MLLEVKTVLGFFAVAAVMIGGGKRVGDVAPREQVGAQTGSLFEYQYQKAASACLGLLEDLGHECIFCEWHDDFVVEFASTLYGFHQVKTKSSNLAPWSVGEVFGVPRAGSVKAASPKKSKARKRKPEPPNSDAIVPKMLAHFLNFGDACEWVVLVTNGNIQPSFRRFLDDVRAATTQEEITGVSGVIFDKLCDSYQQLSIDNKTFFRFLRRFDVAADSGVPTKDAIHHDIADKIHQLSETDLNRSQAVAIGKDLLQLVRERSHRVIDVTVLPVDEVRLKAQKGITAHDVLSLLSLSAEGFKQLKVQSGGVLRQLSRLHTLCEQNGFPPDIIPELCKIKTEWDLWIRDKRHQLLEVDIATLKSECLRALSEQNQPGRTFADLSQRASEIAAKFASLLPAGARIDRQLVMGYIMAIAAEQEIRR